MLDPDRDRQEAERLLEDFSLSGRDIGELPPVADPARKLACGSSFKLFADTYFPATFSLPWSDDR
jgi:hypothetical protein